MVIVCSGLGLVSRGMESRALLTSLMLEKHGVQTLLAGGGNTGLQHQWSVNCISRNAPFLGGRYSPIPWDWRVRIEERTFAELVLRGLAKAAPRNSILFAFQDSVANFLQNAREEGKHNTPVVVTNGFTHHPEKLKKFEHVHVLAPYYLELAQDLRIDTRNWYVVPQPVNVEIFRPLSGIAARRKLGIDLDDFVVLAVGAINLGNKRIDHAIREVGIFKSKNPKVKLVIVGEPEKDTPEVVGLGRKVLGRNVIFRTARHDKMPAVYSVGDVFVLPSRREISGNAFTEAMACGLPVIGDDFPVTRWIIGEGGDTVDMARRGDLASLLEKYVRDDSYRLNRSSRARERAVDTFSTEVVAPKYLSMFEAVMNHQ